MWHLCPNVCIRTPTATELQMRAIILVCSPTTVPMNAFFWAGGNKVLTKKDNGTLEMTFYTENTVRTKLGDYEYGAIPG